MKCVKCSKRTGVLFNDLCAICGEIWDFEKDRFKQANGYSPEPDDFAEWIFQEAKFLNKLLKKENK